MRFWFRVGPNWGVSLGFWGTLFYAFGYLIWLTLLAAVVFLVAVAILVAVAGILAWSAVTWAREPGEGYGSHAGPRLRALWEWLGRDRG